MNELYNVLNKNPMGDLQNALNAIRRDPYSFLRQFGVNVPQGMNDPGQIINHLLQSGQIDQNRIAQAQQIASMMKR